MQSHIQNRGQFGPRFRRGIGAILVFTLLICFIRYVGERNAIKEQINRLRIEYCEALKISDDQELKSSLQSFLSNDASNSWPYIAPSSAMPITSNMPYKIFVDPMLNTASLIFYPELLNFEYEYNLKKDEDGWHFIGPYTIYWDD